MKRLVAFVLMLAMLSVCIGAFAADSWNCSCGQAGNTGAFCPSCGSAKPAVKQANNSNVSVGDYITFGRYEQDDSASNGAEPISWRVLDIQGDTALLLSQYGLHRSVFNDHSNGETWETCSLRTWLNKTFYMEAFTSSERGAILLTHVDESVSQTNDAMAPKRLGNDTDDKIYLLSYAEMLEYLPTLADKMCIPTKYAIKEGANQSKQRYLDNQKTCWWWMRTPAYKNNILCIDWDGTVASCYMNHTYGVVRPCLWVDLTAIGY